MFCNRLFLYIMVYPYIMILMLSAWTFFFWIPGISSPVTYFCVSPQKTEGEIYNSVTNQSQYIFNKFGCFFFLEGHRA